MPPQDNMFEEIRALIQAGERARARELLTGMLRRDPNNAEIWVWMSAVVNTQNERIQCLQEALRIDPQNPAAIRGLAMLGVLPADRLPAATPPVVPPFVEKRQREPFRIKWPKIPWKLPSDKRGWALTGLAVIAVGLILFGIFGSLLSRPKQKAPPLRTIDYNPIASATSATGSPPPPTATNTPSGPTPPWNTLSATYTPTPAYVRTPHDRIEAFSIAVRALDRQEMGKALEYMVQAATSAPDAADISYQIGELLRARGDYGGAVSAYNQAIDLNPAFAPAYLGRAQAGLTSGSLQPADARSDLETAVLLDPILPEARIELARLDLQEGLHQQALDQLQVGELLLPWSPWIYLLRGQVYLAQGDADGALAEAHRANQLDLTLLPVYRLTGEALQASGAAVDSIVPLEIYLRYSSEPDARAQILIARAYATNGEMEKALQAVTTALEISPGDADVLLLRGDFYLDYNQPDLALADFRQALRLEPRSFAAGIAVGRAQLALGLTLDAYKQFVNTERYAASDQDRGQLYYWRAQSLEPLNELAAALRDWQRLLDLPAEAVPEAWRQTALERIAALVTATPTAKPAAP